MKKKYKHELTNKANTEHEASEKEGNNSGLGLSLSMSQSAVGTLNVFDIKPTEFVSDKNF